ncbi:MFS transporter [Nocardia sp. NPDC088792]|uniref:MFS transporter n=1 Tax=Nocardia sp. NPDC088792 TaxID=3364332 RepID=UPI0038107052
MTITRTLQAPTSPPQALLAASYFANVDRFAVAPLLVVIAAAMHAPLSDVALAASGYAFAYGGSQVVWGLLSDRLGRLPVLRIALVGAGLSGLASTVAPTLTVLIALRILTGAFVGAIVPASIGYVGDSVAPRERQRALSDLMAATGSATATATLIAGVVAQFSSWRVVFAIPAIALGLLLLTLRGLPDPARESGGTHYRDLLHSRWLLLVLLLGFVEGGLLLGGATYLAPALQHDGMGLTAAGALAATYGIGVLSGTRIVKPLSMRLPAWALLAIGGTLLVGGFAVMALWQTAIALTLSAVVLGSAYSFMHSTLQTWSTSVLPRARGTVVALFTAALFGGSAVSTAVVAPLAGDGRFGTMFALAAMLGVPLTLAAAIGRARWKE